MRIIEKVTVISGGGCTYKLGDTINGMTITDIEGYSNGEITLSNKGGIIVQIIGCPTFLFYKEIG